MSTLPSSRRIDHHPRLRTTQPAQMETGASEVVTCATLAAAATTITVTKQAVRTAAARPGMAYWKLYFDKDKLADFGVARLAMRAPRKQATKEPLIAKDK